MSRTPIRFPGLYSQAIRILQVELKPSHFFDLLILSLVLLAFLMASATMGVLSLPKSDYAPRLLVAALSLHALAQVWRGKIGIRLRWTGLAFLPLALWVLVDKGTHGVAWIAREQAATALCATATFWIVLHHVRHTVHRWFLTGTLAAAAAAYGALMISSDKNLLPKLVQASSDTRLYDTRMTGPFGTPGLFAAFLLLCLFPVAGVILDPMGVRSRRIAASVAVVFGVIGFAGTQHGPAWYGLCAGAALLCWLLAENRLKGGVYAALFAGLAFFAPKLGVFDSGLFRYVKYTEKLKVAPLAESASTLFKNAPVTGAGSGGFASAFESVRPAGWSLDPDGAGGFFHRLASENGAIGLALFLIPALFLWFSALRLCAATKRRERIEVTRRSHTDGARLLIPGKIPKVAPEPRVALAGILAGTLAAGITLAADCPGPSMTLAIGFAILAGVAARMTETGRLLTTIAPVEKPIVPLRAAIAFAPVVALALYLYPVFESSRLAAFAEKTLDDAERSAEPLKGQPLVLNRIRRDAVTMSEIAARRSLALTPDNARAAEALANAHLDRLRFTGKDETVAEGVAAARLAASISGDEVRPSLPLVALLNATGDKPGALNVLKDLHRRAPRNTPVTLALAQSLLDEGQASEAAKLVAEALRDEPWNAEAKRLLALTGMSSR